MCTLSPTASFAETSRLRRITPVSQPLPADSDDTTETRPPPVPPARSRLVTGARWFLPQFVIVVSGVLVALALNAWWASRQEAALEDFYIRQIRADLDQTAADAARVDSLLWPTDYAAGQLIRAFQRPVPPPVDSLFQWLRMVRVLEDLVPVTGTAEALVASGDLTLIQDDELRTQILKYLNKVSMLREQSRFQTEEWWQVTGDLIPQYDYQETLGRRYSQRAIDSLSAVIINFPVPAGPRRVRFPFDRDAFLSSRDAYHDAEAINAAVYQFRDMRKQILAAGDTLRVHLDR